MFTAKFCNEALERAIKTAAQSALLFFAADKINVLDVDWTAAAGLAAGGALLSVLTSIVSAGVGPSDSPSLVD